MTATPHPLKLVTIVCEALARERLLRLVQECGAHGATVSAASGLGATGERPGDIEESANVRVEVIVTAEAAARVAERVQAEIFPRFACILWECDVRVLRRGKF